MTLRIEVDGESYALDLQRNDAGSEYSLKGAESAAGTVSVAELRSGVFSVLLGFKSFMVYISEKQGALAVSTSTQRYVVSIADARDRATGARKTAASGRIEIRAQMPGKIIKLLVTAGAAVEAGQGVIVVEAMKMQNEMKAPKNGVVTQIRVGEGATVAAGEVLLVVE